MTNCEKSPNCCTASTQLDGRRDDDDDGWVDCSCGSSFCWWPVLVEPRHAITIRFTVVVVMSLGSPPPCRKNSSATTTTANCLLGSRRTDVSQSATCCVSLLPPNLSVVCVGLSRPRLLCANYPGKYSGTTVTPLAVTGAEIRHVAPILFVGAGKLIACCFQKWIFLHSSLMQHWGFVVVGRRWRWRWKWKRRQGQGVQSKTETACHARRVPSGELLILKADCASITLTLTDCVAALPHF